MSTPEEIAQMSSSNGQFAAAITDHGTMAGVLRFQDACQKHAVRPVFGVEAYFVPSVKNDGDGKHERFHLILLAKNNAGLNKLFKMSQIGWQDNFYYKPRIDFDLLEDMVDDDIIALSGCRGSSIAKAIEAGEYGRAEQLSERFVKIFKDDFYFELQAWNPREINDGLLDLASSFGRKAVATADCHFPTHADKGVEEVLLLVSQYPSIGAQTINAAKENLTTLHTCGPDLIDRVNHLYPDRYLRFDDINPYIADATTVLSWFKEAGYDRQDILENTIEVASKCSAEIVKRRNLLPKYMNTCQS